MKKIFDPSAASLQQMWRSILILVSIGSLLGACANRSAAPDDAPLTHPTIGSHVTLRGVAMNSKAGAMLMGPDVWVALPDSRHWPSDVNGRRVEVTGTFAERYDLPVIHDSYKERLQGIPVPPGTDLHAASRRIVLENMKWNVIDK